MRESLAELYRRTQMSSSLEARLPEDVGEGRIARVSTPQSISLLSSGQISVAEVAERVGYAKHSQFSEAFRRCFGVLPKDY